MDTQQESRYQEAKPGAKCTGNSVRMRNKRPLVYQHHHPFYWQQLKILRET